MPTTTGEENFGNITIRMALHKWSIALNYISSLGLYFVFLCSSFWVHSRKIVCDQRRHTTIPKITWTLQFTLSVLFVSPSSQLLVHHLNITSVYGGDT
jgi:hypothetical protein